MLSRRQHDRSQRLAAPSDPRSGRVSDRQPASSGERLRGGELPRSGTGGMGAASRIAIERSTAARQGTGPVRAARKRGGSR